MSPDFICGTLTLPRCVGRPFTAVAISESADVIELHNGCPASVAKKVVLPTLQWAPSLEQLILLQVLRWITY